MQPRVLILLGSKSDLPIFEGALQALEELDVPCEVRVASAHRSPDHVRQLVETARHRGVEVLIAGAGGAAHLAGVAAAHTSLPVIGVPLESSPLLGLDALLSTAQMPPGVPVASMGVGAWGARNAALFAARILAVADESLRDRVERARAEMARAVEAQDRELRLARRTAKPSAGGARKGKRSSNRR